MRRIILLLLLLGLLFVGDQPGKAVNAATKLSETPPEVLAILEQLSPESRVGQLFLVTFNGTVAEPETPIYNLLANYQVGGVVMSSSHSNFNSIESVTQQTSQLIRALQTVANDAAQSPPNVGVLTPDADGERPYIPLFVGLAHTGDSPGVTQQLLGEMTPLPSAMALGATWDVEQARALGEVVGSELAALGVNMMLGPALDVSDTPNPESSGDPGTASFGGNPFWVGRFGQAYISGVHSGAGGQIAVIVRNFPGLGASERALNEDIPTINRPLEELLTGELAPYFAVTGEASDPLTRADGLMLVPARYSGLQGTITSATRPLGFDQAAVNQLFTRPELASWRADGGLLVSESLGLGAVRRYYGTIDAPFPANNIALDAFLAGNDLLYIDQFTRNINTSQTDTVIAVIEQFVQKYNEDPVFAERVDRAVERILTLKWQLYGEFELSITLVDVVLSEVIGQNTDRTLSIAQQAATLIYPRPAELPVRVPRPPASNERIVFLTDSRLVRQCNTCAAQYIPAIDALEQATVRLYGLAGTQQVRSTSLSSYTFEELNAFLSGISLVPEDPDAPTPAPGETPEPEITVGDDLGRADWVVVGLQDIRGETPNAFRRLLIERPDLVRDRQIIVFALGAPYYLDATEVVQISAYYGLYSTTLPFIETAARILFQEISPTSTSPVSILASGYNLPARLAPDPAQLIQIFVETASIEVEPTPTITPTSGEITATADEITVIPGEITATEATPTVDEATPTATPIEPPEVEPGENIIIATGPILDHNGHNVPDGTLVQFSATYLTQGLTEVLDIVATKDGVAQFNFRPGVRGLQEIYARSGGAESDALQIFVPEGGVPAVVTSSSTPSSTTTPIPATPTATQLAATLTPTSTPTSTPTPTPTPEPPPPPVDLSDLVWAFAASIVLSIVGWRVSGRDAAASSRVKLVLAVIISVMISYNYWALQGPGVAWLIEAGGWGPAVFSWAGGLGGLLLGWLWLHREQSGV